MTKKQREPSLLRQIVAVYYEQAKRRKAVRLLERQLWSYDFLSALLVRAGKQLGNGIQLEITNRDGQKMMLTYQKAERSTELETFDDNVFNHLDNEAAVAKFIREHSTR